MSHSVQVVRALASLVSVAILVPAVTVAVSAKAGSRADQSNVPLTSVAAKGRVEQTLKAGADQAPAAKDKPAAAIVNINTATTNELQTLPGIGASVAARILEYRQKNGGFKKLEDLMNVRGIGEKTFLKLKPLITLSPPKAFSL